MKIKGYENLNFVKWVGGKGHLINNNIYQKKLIDILNLLLEEGQYLKQQAVQNLQKAKQEENKPVMNWSIFSL